MEIRDWRSTKKQMGCVTVQERQLVQQCEREQWKAVTARGHELYGESHCARVDERAIGVSRREELWWVPRMCVLRTILLKTNKFAGKLKDRRAS